MTEECEGFHPSPAVDSSRVRVSRLAEAVGPCYTTDSIARVLNYTVEQVDMLVEGCCLLALTTADRHVVFPAFQLHNGRMVRGLPPVLRMLRKGVDDPWSWALWLHSIPPLVEGIPPGASRMAQLIDGEIDRVCTAADRSAESWRS